MRWVDRVCGWHQVQHLHTTSEWLIHLRSEQHPTSSCLYRQTSTIWLYYSSWLQAKSLYSAMESKDEEIRPLMVLGKGRKWHLKTHLFNLPYPVVVVVVVVQPSSWRNDLESDAFLPGLRSGTIVDERQISGIFVWRSDRLKSSVRKRTPFRPRCFTWMFDIPSGPIALKALAALTASHVCSEVKVGASSLLGRSKRFHILAPLSIFEFHANL